MKIIVALLQSIDGYLAKSHTDDLSWGSKEDKTFFKTTTKEIGTMLMGSTTFNAMKGIQNGIAFKDRRCLVFTSKPEEYADYKNEYAKVEFFKGTATEAVSYLKQQGIEQAVVIGGGKLVQQFLAAKLVNEVYVTIAPQIFGSGVKMCDGAIESPSMRLADLQRVSANEIILHYIVD